MYALNSELNTMHRMRLLPGVLGAALLVSATATLAAAQFSVTFGPASWDGVSLQEILDAEYGAGTINVPTDYEGYLPGDADPGYWEDLGLDAIIVREIAGWENQNTMGWYLETLAGAPSIDGTDDGVVFTGPMSEGQVAVISFPNGLTRFGLYLNPNGTLDATNAPEPEMHFTNRAYNDTGANGGPAIHAPFDGDVQCLIFNITALRGRPTWVVAWEDIDSGSEITSSWTSTTTDNDFNDLVVEITAESPVTVDESSWSRVKSLFQNN